VVLLIDNYDSFVHNLARYVRELGHDTRVVRNDRVDLDDLLRAPPTHLIVSPGPCAPDRAGASCDAIAALSGRVPVLGVCLGHQCVAAVHGARVERSGRPIHGRATDVHHDGSGIFAGLPSPFRAGRYHSLVVPPASVGDPLRIAAHAPDGAVMAVAHRDHPVWGVQFHPESILTEHGHALLRNFLDL